MDDNDGALLAADWLRIRDEVNLTQKATHFSFLLLIFFLVFCSSFRSLPQNTEQNNRKPCYFTYEKDENKRTYGKYDQ